MQSLNLSNLAFDTAAESILREKQHKKLKSWEFVYNNSDIITSCGKDSIEMSRSATLVSNFFGVLQNFRASNS